MKKRLFSWKNEKPQKTVAVIRYGAYGDVLQSASILPGLKRQGYHVTFICTPRGVEAIRYDPHIDRILIQKEDIVPNHELMDYFKALGKKYTKVINLCETVEGIVLPMSSRAHFHWPKEARHNICNRNYMEMQHQIACVEFEKPETCFYPNKDELAWAQKERAKVKGKLIVWALTGSAFHKIWPYVDGVVANLIKHFPDCVIAFVGGQREEKLQGDWHCENVWRMVGKLSIRESMTLAKVADIVVGPETGILNAVSMENNAKVLLLSHSTVENLSRDWNNTISLCGPSECYPCHRLQLDGWKYCNRHESGVAMCQTMIKPEDVFNAIADQMIDEQELVA